MRQRRTFLVLLAVAGASAVTAVAATGRMARHVPAPRAARAVDAAPQRVANATAISPSGPWEASSKTTAIGAAQTTIASLSLAPGSYQLTAAGSAYIESGQGAQSVGCHLVLGDTDEGDAYLGLDAGTVTQQTYALVALVTVKARTTAQVECLLGSNPADAVSTQANLVAIRA
jgi:hypothetical protein